MNLFLCSSVIKIGVCRGFCGAGEIGDTIVAGFRNQEFAAFKFLKIDSFADFSFSFADFSFMSTLENCSSFDCGGLSSVDELLVFIVLQHFAFEFSAFCILLSN